MLASAAEFRPASMGCWSAAVTTEVLLPATRLAWYTVAVGASSEPPVASSWAPIGADGPWSPSDEATLTASSFSGGRKTALPRLPPPPPPPPSSSSSLPPPPPLPVALGEHVLGGGSVGTVSHSRQSTAQRVAYCHASTRRLALSSHCHAMSIAGPTLSRGDRAHSTFSSFPLVKECVCVSNDRASRPFIDSLSISVYRFFDRSLLRRSERRSSGPYRIFAARFVHKQR